MRLGWGAVLVAMALAGCDGGGSTSFPAPTPTPTTTPAPTPTPSPSPTPTPTPAAYETAFDFSRNRTIPMLFFNYPQGFEYEVGKKPQPYIVDDFHFSQDPAAGTVEIGYGYGAVGMSLGDFHFFYRANPYNGVLYNSRADILRADTNAGPYSRRAVVIFPVAGIQYAATGEGNKPVAGAGGYFERMLLGARTRPGDAPAAATLTYPIAPDSYKTLGSSGVETLLYPSGNLVVNTATRAVGGTITVPSLSGGPAVHLTISGTLNAADLSLSGDVTNDASIPAGSFAGWLFGPSATEAGILIQVANTKTVQSYFFPVVGKRAS